MRRYSYHEERDSSSPRLDPRQQRPPLQRIVADNVDGVGPDYDPLGDHRPWYEGKGQDPETNQSGLPESRARGSMCKGDSSEVEYCRL